MNDDRCRGPSTLDLAGHMGPRNPIGYPRVAQSFITHIPLSFCVSGSNSCAMMLWCAVIQRITCLLRDGNLSSSEGLDLQEGRSIRLPKGPPNHRRNTGECIWVFSFGTIDCFQPTEEMPARARFGLSTSMSEDSKCAESDGYDLATRDLHRSDRRDTTVTLSCVALRCEACVYQPVAMLQRSAARQSSPQLFTYPVLG